jgi:succinate dehydrogenase/fumarate reductase flavoprotein subunit
VDVTCDVLVVGSGAAGFAAAVTAAADGLNVVMVEKANVFGGSTCYSAGLVWIPDSRQSRAAGLQDSADAALRYLDSEAGTHLDRENAEVYVHQAAQILAWFEDNSHVAFSLVPAWPDYHQAFQGSVRGGRSLGPKPFDGRTLGARFGALRPPVATTMILGGMMVGREDLPKFYSMTRSWSSAARVTTLVMRYVRDRLTGHRRGTRLSNGNALIGMLARSAFDRGVTLQLETAMTTLLTEDGRVVGATVRGTSGEQTIRARGGVVLAGGGFPGSDTLRAKYFGHVHAGKNHRTITPTANSGDGLIAATAIGAAVVEAQISPAAWTPMSLVPQPDGSTLPFPHFNDIAVDRRGTRFCSEALSYHDFVPKMVEACRTDHDISCHVICDSHWIRRHGLGMAPPAPGRLGPHVASGYIKQGNTIAALASQCGIDPVGLQATVARFNLEAARGEDPEFHKGADHYERFNGSFGHTPNPCLAPLQQAPFYAVKLVPGDIGTFVGLRADAAARVLNTEGQPIAGLYAAGNDAGSFMGGTYPGAGTSIGPAMVFGHLAARHIAQTVRRI